MVKRYNRKTKFWIVPFVICFVGCISLSVLLLFLANAVSTSPRMISGLNPEPLPADPYTLSSEQQALVTQSGYPAGFLILFYQSGSENSPPQDVRLEIWSYFQAGLEITFLNGVSIHEETIEQNSSFMDPQPYHPEQFIAGMDIDSVLRSTGLKEYIQTTADGELVTDGKVLYGKQIATGFQNGGLKYVEGFALESEDQP